MLIQKFEGLFITLTKILSESEAILHLSYHLIITDYIKNEPCRNNDFFCNMCVFYARSLPENKRIRNRFSFIFCWWRITSIWGNQRFLLFVMLGQQKKFELVVVQWYLTLIQTYITQMLIDITFSSLNQAIYTSLHFILYQYLRSYSQNRSKLWIFLYFQRNIITIRKRK